MSGIVADVHELRAQNARLRAVAVAADALEEYLHSSYYSGPTLGAALRALESGDLDEPGTDQ